MKFTRIKILIISIFFFSFCSAQTDSSLITQSPVDSIKANDTTQLFIASISIYGNDKTRSSTIEREIPFKQGDYVSAKDIQKKMQIAKEQLFNTSLFLYTSVFIQNRYGNFVFITVLVKERWYIFPLPYFSLADRNINTWLVTYHHSFKRINYGVKFLYNNITGRNDSFALWLITGYSRQISFKYARPFFDSKMHNGYRLFFNYTNQREVNYATYLSKQAFYKPDDLQFLRHSLRAEADYIYRPGLRTRHTFSLGYTTENVSDSVIKLNSNYLPGGRTHAAFPTFGYTFQYFNTDYNAYPTKGFLSSASLSYRGFNSGINITQLQLISSYTMPIAPKTQLQFKEGGVLSLPFNQPFYLQKMFGYGNGSIFMQGLEYYVIDGVAGIIGRATLQHQLLNVNFRLAQGTKQQTDLPFTVYGKIYYNAGYAYDKDPGNSLLNNKFLYSYGFGVDVITFYDIVFKFDYSFNQLGQSGLFIHVRTDF